MVIVALMMVACGSKDVVMSYDFGELLSSSDSNVVTFTFDKKGQLVCSSCNISEVRVTKDSKTYYEDCGVVDGEGGAYQHIGSYTFNHKNQLINKDDEIFFIYEQDEIKMICQLGSCESDYGCCYLTIFDNGNRSDMVIQRPTSEFMQFREAYELANGVDILFTQGREWEFAGE